jgi:hypothetical protein
MTTGMTTTILTIMNTTMGTAMTMTMRTITTRKNNQALQPGGTCRAFFSTQV